MTQNSPENFRKENPDSAAGSVTGRDLQVRKSIGASGSQTEAGGERLQQRTGSRGRTDAQQPRARASGPLLLPGARGGLAPKARSEAGARPRTLKQAHKRDARGPALAGPAGGPHCEQVGFTLGLGQVTRHSDLRTRALVGLT